MQKFKLTILLIICSNGLAYAQTFNETPILPFMPQKEMKFPKISGLPDIKSTLSETNPVFSNSLPLAEQYELRKKILLSGSCLHQLFQSRATPAAQFPLFRI